MIKKTLLALAGVAVFWTAQASNWEPVGQGNGYTVSVETGSIKSETGGFVRAWIRAD
jgi:hypothetical protein